MEADRARSTRRPVLCLIAGDAHPNLGCRLAQTCGISVVPTLLKAYADGETRVRIEADIAGAEVCIVQPTCPPVNDHLIALALIADAAKAAGAARISAVVPYFGYARQDMRHHAGEPRSARLASRLLAAAGIERLITVELHSAALESAFDMPVVDLRADAALLPAIRAWGLDKPMVVSPDAGGLKRAQRYADALDAPLAAVVKTRLAPDVAAVSQLLGDARGRDCVIVDDMCSTGGTVAHAARALLAAGAREVNAAFIHPVMGPEALGTMIGASVHRLLTTDSVPVEADPRLQIVSIVPLLADCLGLID